MVNSRFNLNVICEACGIKFHKRKSFVERNNHHYCSVKCRANYWRGEKHHWFGRKHTKEAIKKITIGNLGKKQTEKTKEKIKLNHANFKRENHPRWKGGYDPYGRDNEIYRDWRINVYERDNYTCQICGDDKGHNLNAHHIESFTNYPELRYEISNGITLCENCHIEIHKNKEWKLCQSVEEILALYPPKWLHQIANV